MFKKKYHNACLLGADPPPTEMRDPWKAGGDPSKKERKRKRNGKEKSPHKTLGQAEDYSEIAHMGANREGSRSQVGLC